MIKNCHKCKRIINQKSINAQGYNFHPECFICMECKKKIKDSFNSKGPEFYHPECYKKKLQLFCTVCKKDLGQNWIEKGSRKYHETCYQKCIQLKCGICGKPIEGEYTRSKEGNFHDDCFEKDKALKCDVCQNIINGEYVIDLWGNKSHKKHEGLEPAFCDCCSRVLSDATSKGFRKHDDGRKICGICKITEIISFHQTVPSKMKVIDELKAVGLNFIPPFITISLADKITINKMLGASITNNTHGYTKTVHKSENGRLVKREHSISMLFGLPKLQFEAVLAHEFLHVWLHEKNLDMPDEQTEGFCNLGAALIYKNDGSEFSKILLKGLENDPDKVYGDGYRVMNKKLEALGWESLIKDVLSYKPKLVK